MSQEAEQQVEAPPVEDGSMSFEDAMNAALQANAEDIQSPFDEQPPEEAHSEEPQESAEQEVAPPDADAPEISDPPASEPEEAPAPSKSLARIMEREAKILEREQKLQQAQPELEELRGRVEQYESAQRQFTMNPTEFIRSMAPDMDLKQLAETLWYESQGAQAPQSYLSKKAATQQNSELVERIAKIERGQTERMRNEQQYAAQQSLARYQGSLESFAKAADQESLPHLAAMQSKDPQWVAGAMLEAAQSHARATNGQVMSPEQAAKAVDAHIAKFQLQQAKNEAQAQQAKEGASLRNNSTQIQPDREPEDELSDEFLRRKALAAAGLDPDLF